MPCWRSRIAAAMPPKPAPTMPMRTSRTPGAGAGLPRSATTAVEPITQPAPGATGARLCVCAGRRSASGSAALFAWHRPHAQLDALRPQAFRAFHLLHHGDHDHTHPRFDIVDSRRLLVLDDLGVAGDDNRELLASLV